MTTDSFTFGSIHCQVAATPGSNKIAYILFPLDDPKQWLTSTAQQFGINIVMVTGMNWDNDLTPWPAPGVPAGSAAFKGLAPQFLARLVSEIIPQVERKVVPDTVPQRSLIGISLSGLFAMWAWPQSPEFKNIATLSGSFWYKDFCAWLADQNFNGISGKCFMLLGDKESLVRQKTFATVGRCTQQVLSTLRAANVNVTFRLVPGNHYQDTLPRLNLAMQQLYSID